MLRFEDVIAIDKSDPNFESKMKSKIVKQWHYAQNEVRKAWKIRFKFKTASEVSDLLKLIFYVDRPGLNWNSSQVLVPGGGIYELNTKMHGFHKAVLYLHEHPRHAKTCENEECRRHFVHAHGKRTYCLFPDSRGETCAQKGINEDKRKWWRTKGDKQRKAKKKVEKKRKNLSQ